MRRLSSLKVERLRQLNSLEIRELGSVNLIVGGNNSGKTTLLDAIRLYAGRGTPSLLEQLLSEHGEFGFSSGEEAEEGSLDRSVANLFYGRRFPNLDGAPIYVGETDRSRYVQLEHVLLREEFEERDIAGEITAVRRLRRVEKARVSELADLVEALEITQADGIGLAGPIVRGTAVPLSELFSSRRLSRPRFEEGTAIIPYSYVSSRSEGSADLAAAWDEVVLTEGERYALDALRLIDDETQGLAFVQWARMRRMPLSASRKEERTAVIRVSSHPWPVPLQSMGDGMTRVLQLILAAFRAKGGFLLIDEFENGLHFSVQIRIWKLLFALARDNAIQVFATTHSLDCVRAFSHVANEDPLEGVLIRMERDNRQTVAAEVTEEALEDLIASMIEVR